MPLRPPAGFIRPGYDPLKVPNAPTIGTPSAGNTQVSVVFTAPTNVGGSAITGYQAVAYASGSYVSNTAGTSSPITVTGLSNGTAYTFQVWAQNTYGPSAYSAMSASATPSPPSFISDLYNGYGNSVATDSSSIVYVAGYQSSVNYWELAKYDSTGTLLWQKNFDVTGSYVKIRTDSSGNVLLVQPSSSNIRVIKVSSSGTITWQRTIIGWPSGCSGVQIQYAGVSCDTSGNVYVSAPVYANCQYGYTVVKINSSGTIQWSRSLQSNLYGSEFVSCAADSSGNVYSVGGTTYGSYNRAFICKHDTSGNLVWQRVIGSNSSSSAYAKGVAVSSDGSQVFLAGEVNGGYNQALLACYDSSGNLSWARTLDNGSTTYGIGVACDSSSNAYITGYTSSNSAMYMAKYNSSGTIQWQRSITNASSRKSYGYDAAVDANGSPIFFGLNTNSSNADARFFTVKLPSDGSKTGTYTVSSTTWVYGASSLTAANYTPDYNLSPGKTPDSLSLSLTTPAYVLNTSSMTTGTVTLT